MSEPTVVAEDLYRLQLVGSPVIVAGSIVAVIETIDAGATKYRSRLASFPLNVSQKGIDPSAVGPTWLTETGPWSDLGPLAERDERIAFVSTRSGTREGYVLDPSGDLHPLAEVVAPINQLGWYDDGHLLAHVERPDPATHDGASIHVDWLRYKSDGRSGFREPTSELWLLGLDGSARLVNRCTGRITQLSITDDGVVVVVEPRHSDETHPVSEVRLFDIAEGPDDPGLLLWSICAKITALVATSFSGRLVAVSSGVFGQSVTPPRLWLLDGKGDAELLLEDPDLDCERGLFSDSRPSGPATLLQPVIDSDEVLYLHVDGHEQAVSIVDTATRRGRRISPTEQSVTDFSAAIGNKVALCLESSISPTELGVLVGHELTMLSDLNDVSTRAVRPEFVDITAEDGLRIDALLYRPTVPPQNGPRLLLRVHGGPHGSYGNSFDLETQVEVAAGFTVLAPNIRGSSGRGAAFRAMSVGEWGRADHADLMAVTDWAVTTGVASEDSLYLAGGSYGGYLINWTLTRTDRFRAAVSERSISNLVSKFGTSDIGYTTNRYEFEGRDVLDDSIVELLELSPLRHVSRITTPILLIHGENDYRCPIEQSEQMFVALRRLGRDCEFVRFPGGSHDFAASGRPDHRFERLKLIVDWLCRH